MSYKHCVQKATVSVKSLHNTNTSFMLYQKQIQLVLTANTTKIKMMIGRLLCPQTQCRLQSGPFINWLYSFQFRNILLFRILKMARNYNCASFSLSFWLWNGDLNLAPSGEPWSPSPYLPLCNHPQCQYLENAIL